MQPSPKVLHEMTTQLMSSYIATNMKSMARDALRGGWKHAIKYTFKFEYKDPELEWIAEKAWGWLADHHHSEPSKP